jgi:hypothetical protein
MYNKRGTTFVEKVLTYPLSHPTEAVALYSMPEMVRVVLKLYARNIYNIVRIMKTGLPLYVV